MNTTILQIERSVLASREKRFVNLILDFLARLTLTCISIWGLSILTGNDDLSHFLMGSQSVYGFMARFVFSATLLWMYYVLMEGATKGRTLGKYITNTMVVKADGSPIGYKEAITRSLYRMIPFEIFSFTGEICLGWHDTFSKTYVVDKKRFKKVYKSL